MELNNARIIIEKKNGSSPIIFDNAIRIDDDYKCNDDVYIQVAIIHHNPVSVFPDMEMHYIILKKDIDNIKVKLL